MFESTFGVEPTITDRFFSKDDVCGLPAYQYSVSYTHLTLPTICSV